MTGADSNSVNGSPFNFSEDLRPWKDAPVLIGSTRFMPLPHTENIMITGGAGFIASWVVRHLTMTYPAYNIVSFDKLDYCFSLKNTRMPNGTQNFTFYKGDITNENEVLDCLGRHNIDTIFHFAAQSHVDQSFCNSYNFTHTNVYGTHYPHVLLESARKVGIKWFIHISTDEVYGEAKDDDRDFLETRMLAPTNLYAASKTAAEMLVHSYLKSFILLVIIAYCTNVFSLHRYPEKIISKFIYQLNRGQPVTLQGDGSPTRWLLYAGDAASAFDMILHKGQVGQIYNIGADLLEEFQISQSTPGDVQKWDHQYAIDDTKLRWLGWEQKIQGISRSVDGYSNQVTALCGT
ncbi:hypothetical protein DFH08DRAFT_910858 [Mycena albidolilacea]|uniref:NAD-dependent epimerase/dehydratase domain-containing protein n=1 Tax=Mycena albidolilacea TaxID=1033008 RepID=A0AAD7AMX0_9AGAR|nr:hypothetical protein DFH08DRAFT_910858 [Mycena albidolilacea]